MKLKLSTLVIMILILSGCSGKPTRYDIGDNQSMSLAMKVMMISGQAGYFKDVPPTDADKGSNGIDSGSPITSALMGADILTNGASLPSSFHINSSGLGAMFLLNAFIGGDERYINVVLNKTIHAWVPSDIVSSKREAEELVLNSYVQAVRKVTGDEFDNIETPIKRYNDTTYISFYTNSDVYIDSKNIYAKQKSLGNNFPIRGGVSVDQSKTWLTDDTPFPSKKLYYHIVGRSNMLPLKRDEDINKTYFEIANHMPSWFYQFLYVDKVPLVLNNHKVNLFVIPTYSAIKATP